MDLSVLPITHAATIPESYIDEMGHMNVMWYTHLFDQAIFGALGLVGLSLEYMQQNDSGGFALESHIRYLAEVRVGHDVELRTRILGRTQKRFHLMNFMTNLTDQRLSSTFEVVGAHIDMTQRRMSPMPENIGQKLDELINVHNQIDWQPPTCGVMRP